MQINNQLFGAHLDRLSRSMDRTSERHTMLVGNLANINTPGYKRRDMDFSIALDEADGSGSKLKQWREQRLQSRQNSSSNRVDGNSVDLEAEVAAIAETELRYQALTELTSRYFGGLRSVIREGR